MERKSIFKPCDMEYKGYDKPVRYTEEFLKELAENSLGTQLVGEKHLSASIGDVTNIMFTDGELFADINTDKSLDDLMYSPRFDCTLVDNGDHFLATDGKLLEVSLTSNPRRAILNNTDDNGGSRMVEGEDKTKEFLANEVERLNKELAKKDLLIERNKEKLDKFEEMEKEVGELRDWKETNSKILDEQKPIVESYKKQQEEHRSNLLDKVSKGNPQLREQFESFSTENLETYIKLHTEEQPAKGVGADNAPGLDEGKGSDSEEEKVQKDLELAKSMFTELNKEE